MEPTQPVPIAKWDSARDAWVSPGSIDLFSELSDVFSETFPTSVSMRKSLVYARPTQVHHTNASGSSLLPTPEAKLSDSGPDYARANRQGSGGDDLITALFKLER